jgi:hypothetical protein
MAVFSFSRWEYNKSFAKHLDPNTHAVSETASQVRQWMRDIVVRIYTLVPLNRRVELPRHEEEDHVYEQDNDTESNNTDIDTESDDNTQQDSSVESDDDFKHGSSYPTHRVTAHSLLQHDPVNLMHGMEVCHYSVNIRTAKGRKQHCKLHQPLYSRPH